MMAHCVCFNRIWAEILVCAAASVDNVFKVVNADVSLTHRASVNGPKSIPSPNSDYWKYSYAKGKDYNLKVLGLVWFRRFIPFQSVLMYSGKQTQLSNYGRIYTVNIQVFKTFNRISLRFSLYIITH